MSTVWESLDEEKRRRIECLPTESIGQKKARKKKGRLARIAAARVVEDEIEELPVGLLTASQYAMLVRAEQRKRGR